MSGAVKSALLAYSRGRERVNQAGVAQGSQDGVRVAGLGVYIRNIDNTDLVT